MPFFDLEELAEARVDMAEQLGPHTLTIRRILEGESETGGPDRSEQALVDGGGKQLAPLYRARPLRAPRTQREGEQTIVVADWEVRLPWPYLAVILRGDLLEAVEGRFSVNLVDTRADALLCRLECLRLEPAR